jgi:hypothetical protein
MFVTFIAHKTFTYDSAFIKPAGITAHESKLKIKINKGANKNIREFVGVGTKSSLAKSLSPSANGCNNPYSPTTLGPFRRCTDAIILRSAKV